MVTTNKSLVEPPFNNTSGTLPDGTPYTSWDGPVNYNMTTLDNALGSTTAINVAGVTTTQTFTLAQYQSLMIDFTGVLSNDVLYNVPAGVGGFWIISNSCTANFSVSIGYNVGTVKIPKGGQYLVFVDTTTSPYINLLQISGLATNAGNPNGVVAGNSTSPASILWDTTNGIIWICTTSGPPSTAVWTASAPAGSYVPTATVLEYYGTTAPAGYLFANAQAVSRTTYAALFAVVGTTYGVGDGSTTFNVPDKRGTIAVGADNMGGSAANKIQVTVNITTTNLSTAATVASATGLCKGMTVIAAGVPTGTTIANIVGTAVTLSANATASATVSGRFSMFSDAQVVGAVGGEAAHQLSASELASHTHPFGSAVFGAGGGGISNALQGPGSSINTLTNTGDQVHNNIQPSIICNFIIKT